MADSARVRGAEPPSSAWTDRETIRAVFAALEAGLCTVDRSGSVVLCNQSAERLLGFGAGELPGRDLRGLVCPGGPRGEPAAGAECPLSEVLRTGRPVRRDEDVLLRPDGTSLPVAWTCTPLLRGDRVEGAVVVFQDITVRQDVQARQEARLLRGEAARQHAEDVSAATAWLAEVSMALVSTLDAEEGLERLARLLVPRLADWAALDLLVEPGGTRRVCTDDRRLVVRGGTPPFPVSLAQPLARVLHGAGTRIVRSTGGSEPASGPPGPGEAVALVVPLRLREHTYGAMTLTRADPGRPFTPAEVILAEDVARWAALALESARLYDAQASIAAALQRSLLTELPSVEGLDLAARYRPAQRTAEVGGDWYDAFLLPDGTLAVAVGDVVGHDLEAAVRMGALRNMLRALAVDRPETPGHTLRRLDAAMGHLDTADSATVVYGHLHPAEAGQWEFCWSSAGHPPALLIGPDGRSALLEAGRGILLGVLPEERRPTARVLLPPGATLLLYTDGLVESRLQSLDEGLTRLRREGGRVAGRPLDTLCADLIDALGFTDDDVTVIAVRVRAEP